MWEQGKGNMGTTVTGGPSTPAAHQTQGATSLAGAGLKVPGDSQQNDTGRIPVHLNTLRRNLDN